MPKTKGKFRYQIHRYRGKVGNFPPDLEEISYVQASSAYEALKISAKGSEREWGVNLRNVDDDRYAYVTEPGLGPDYECSLMALREDKQ